MAFKLYDKDKDGYITKGEMVKLSKTLTKEQVEKVEFQQKFNSIFFHLNLVSGIFQVWFWWWWEIKLSVVQEDDEQIKHI